MNILACSYSSQLAQSAISFRQKDKDPLGNTDCSIIMIPRTHAAQQRNRVGPKLDVFGYTNICSMVIYIIWSGESRPKGLFHAAETTDLFERFRALRAQQVTLLQRWYDGEQQCGFECEPVDSPEFITPGDFGSTPG